MKPRLPIDKISAEEFDKNIKTKYLDKEILDDKTLEKLAELFCVNKTNTGKIHCDECHAHGYKCVYFYNPTTGVIDRLLREIRQYKKRFEEIKETMDKYPFS